MKILIADKFEESGIQELKSLGCEVICNPNLEGETLVEAILTSQADVLVVRSTKVNEAMLNVGRLSLVVRAGVDYDTIDVKAASARGIFVSNCPGKDSVQAREAIAAETVRIIRAFKETGRALNAVNLSEHPITSQPLAARECDQPRAPERVFNEIEAANIKKRERENIWYEGAD